MVDDVTWEMIQNPDKLELEQLKDTINALGQLLRYAQVRKYAVQDLRDGNITLANEFDGVCRQLYTQLPRGIKW